MALQRKENGRDNDAIHSSETHEPEVADQHDIRAHDCAVTMPEDSEHASAAVSSQENSPLHKSGSHTMSLLVTEIVEGTTTNSLSKSDLQRDLESPSPEEGAPFINPADSGGEEAFDEDALKVLDSIEDLDITTLDEQSLSQIPQGWPSVSSSPRTILRSRPPSLQRIDTEETIGFLDPFVLDTTTTHDSEQQLLSNDASEQVVVDTLPPARQDALHRAESSFDMSDPLAPDSDETARPYIRSLEYPPLPGAADRDDGVEDEFAKLIRRLRKCTDKVLIKRTQWRLEYETVQNLRLHLSESTSLLKSALEMHRATENLEVGPISKRKKKRKKPKNIEPTGDVGQLKDTDADLSTGGHSDAGTMSTGQSVSSSVDSSTTHHSALNMERYFNRYLEDLRALETQEMNEKKCMEELSGLEFRQAKLFKKVEGKMHSSTRDLREEVLSGSALSSDSRSRAGSEEQLHPLLEEYFELQGSIGVFLERLGELDYEHGEGLQERDFLRDHLEEVAMSDDEFDSNYKDTRFKTEQELIAAREKFAMVEERCRISGLDPELYRNASGSAVREAPLGLTAKGLSSSKVFSPVSRGPSSTAIDRWLLDVTEDSLPADDESPVADSFHTDMAAELEDPLQPFTNLEASLPPD